MTTDLIVPGLGEIVDLEGPTDQIARAFDGLNEFIREAVSAKRQLADVMLRRMDFEARYTARLGNLEIKGQAPGVEYDADKLRHELLQFAADGVISADAVDSAVEIVESLKVRVRGVNALRKLGGTVQATIDGCVVPVSRPRTISVRIVK